MNLILTGFYLILRMSDMTAFCMVGGGEQVVDGSSNTEQDRGKLLGNPSGPKDFPFCVEFTALLSSAVEKVSVAASVLIAGISKFSKNRLSKASFPRDSVVYNFE